MQLHFPKLVQQYGGDQQVLFASVSIQEMNDPLVSRLSIVALPTFQLIHQSRTMDSVVCSARELGLVLQPRLDQFLASPSSYQPPVTEIPGTMNAAVRAHVAQMQAHPQAVHSLVDQQP
jgi:hypothetical protein